MDGAIADSAPTHRASHAPTAQEPTDPGMLRTMKRLALLRAGCPPGVRYLQNAAVQGSSSEAQQQGPSSFAGLLSSMVSQEEEEDPHPAREGRKP